MALSLAALNPQNFTPVQAPNPVARQKSLADARAMQQTEQLRTQQLQQGEQEIQAQQAAMAKAKAVTDVLVRNQGDFAKALPELKTIDPQFALGVEKELQNIATSKATIDRGKRDDEIKLIEMDNRRLESLAKTAKDALDANKLIEVDGELVDPTTRTSVFQSLKSKQPQQSETTQYNQRLTAFNADPKLTAQYGQGPMGLDKYEQAQRVQTAQASRAQVSGLPPGTAQRVGQIASQFDSHKLVTQFNEIANSYDTVKGIVGNKMGGPGDLATVFQFMRALDPTSVVRESEYATAAKSGNIFSGWAAKYNGYLKPEGGFLPERVKQDFVKILDEKIKASAGQYRNLRNEYARRIDKWTGEGDGEDYLTEYAPFGSTGGDGARGQQNLDSVLDRVFGPAPVKK